MIDPLLISESQQAALDETQKRIDAVSGEEESLVVLTRTDLSALIGLLVAKRVVTFNEVITAVVEGRNEFLRQVSDELEKGS